MSKNELWQKNSAFKSLWMQILFQLYKTCVSKVYYFMLQKHVFTIKFLSFVIVKWILTANKYWKVWHSLKIAKAKVMISFWYSNHKKPKISRKLRWCTDAGTLLYLEVCVMHEHNLPTTLIKQCQKKSKKINVLEACTYLLCSCPHTIFHEICYIFVIKQLIFC